MKVFVWERVGNATFSYHHEGGVVVIASDLEAARQLLRAEEAPSECGAFDDEPDVVYDVAGDAAPKVFIFPDAGCC